MPQNDKQHADAHLIQKLLNVHGAPGPQTYDDGWDDESEEATKAVGARIYDETLKISLDLAIQK